MQELYKSDDIESVKREYTGWIVKSSVESIKEAVDSYYQGEYDKTLEEAKAMALCQPPIIDPEFYYVEVTYVGYEIALIKGDKHE